MNCLIETPLCAVQGDDEQYDLTFTLDGTTPLDLTGSTFQFIIGATRGTPLADTLMPSAYIVITDAPNGKAMLQLSSNDTNQPLGTYFYRMKWTNAGGKIKTIMKGTLSIEWAK